MMQPLAPDGPVLIMSPRYARGPLVCLPGARMFYHAADPTFGFRVYAWPTLTPFVGHLLDKITRKNGEIFFERKERPAFHLIHVAWDGGSTTNTMYYLLHWQDFLDRVVRIQRATRPRLLRWHWTLPSDQRPFVSPSVLGEFKRVMRATGVLPWEMIAMILQTCIAQRAQTRSVRNRYGPVVSVEAKARDQPAIF